MQHVSEHPFERSAPPPAPPTYSGGAQPKTDATRGLVIYEMGSNSLKRHLIHYPEVGRSSVTTTKLPWDVSHQFYAKTPSDHPRTRTEDLASTVAAGLEDMLNRDDTPDPALHGFILATGVFRDIDDIGVVSERVYAATGLRLKVMSGSDEARLMASAARKAKLRAPALITDLGGSTLQYAELTTDSQGRTGSLPLGAIRNHHAFAALAQDPERYLRDSAAYCDALLSEVPRIAPLHATGGTAKTLAKITGHSRITSDELRQLVAQLLYEGPPPNIKPHRARVLLPGAVILWRLAAHCRADAIHYQGVAIRDGMLRRFGRAILKVAASNVHATQLLKPTFEG